MSDPVTDFICPTQKLVDFALERLAQSSRFHCYRLPWMDPEKIQEFMPDLMLPAVTVSHGFSTYGNRPRRTANLVVLVIVDASSPDASASADSLCDEVIHLLDQQVNENALYQIQQFRSLYADAAVQIHQLDFEVSDH